jgi:hypothetical protein
MTSVVQITVSIFCFVLLICDIGFTATNRDTEALLGTPHKPLKKEVIPSDDQALQSEKLDATHGPLKKQHIPNGQVPRSENEQKTSAKSVPDKNKQTDSMQQNIENGVQVKLQNCHYSPDSQSVTCTFQLTSPSEAFKLALYCYSGIQAVDANNKILQCNEIQMGQNRSWEYVVATLDKGAQVKAEVNLQAASPITSISKMQMVISANGKRQIVQLTNIAVH